MKALSPLYLILAIGYCCYPYSSSGDCVTTNSESKQSQMIESEESTRVPECLSSFKNVIDTLNIAGREHVHSEYFLYDITKDGTPELCVISGSCEADKKLWIYTLEKGKVRKIYSDYGGHTDFFLNGNSLGSVTCNTGEGYVCIYSYEKGKIKIQIAGFSAWNYEGAIAFKKNEQWIIDLWVNSNCDIPLTPLK